MIIIHPAPCALNNIGIGGFFLFGGVIMFFDRAMYAPRFSWSSHRFADDHQASHGKCMTDPLGFYNEHMPDALRE